MKCNILPSITNICFCLAAILSSTQLFGQSAEIVNPVHPYWKTRGNTGTDTSTYFLGTLDGNYLTFRTNNVRRMTIDLNGNTGIGTVYPQEKLHLYGTASTARIEGVGTGGTYLTNTTTATDKLLWADLNGTVRGLPNGPAGSVLTISNTTTSPAWTSPNGLFWQLTGNTGTNDPAVPVTYGTSTIAATENWIGTTDANDFVIGTNNIERFRVMKATGNVGIGSAAPTNKLTIQPSAFTTPANPSTYALAINNTASSLDYALGSSASYVYEQTWNAKPLLINSQGNYVGVNLATAPIQNLDVNGRVNVANGVVQRGTTAITATNDLGLYSQISANWIRIAANSAPIKFFTDQGGAGGIGTNATMAIDNSNGGGVMIAAETGGTGNAGAPNARAALEISSTTKGMLTPRLTTAQRDAMGGFLAEGLLIYNIDNDCFEWWDTRANPNGTGGFWNSLCDFCENVIIINSNQTGFNLNSYVGGGKPQNYCVYVTSGVTLQAAANGGASSAPGYSGFDASTMPNGAKIKLFNYGNILAGGGNGGRGAWESDAVCQGDGGAGPGGAGGNAIQTNFGVQVTVYNYGLIRAGGGGGGGAGAGCCSAGGGGGGGAGTPPGSGGNGSCYNCTANFICSCGGRTGCSATGSAGTAIVPGVGGVGAGSSSSGCSGNSNGGTGATGGVNGVAGSSQGTGCCSGGCAGAGGGAAGLALQGNGSGSSITNIGGTTTGSVNP